MEESKHPLKVVCEVQGYEGLPLVIAPCVRLVGREAALAAARKGKESRDWVVPFWLLRRSSDLAECNCTLTHIEVDVIFTGAVGDASTPAAAPRVVFDSHFKVPVIVNTRPIAEDAELVLHSQVPKPKAKGAPKKAAPPLKRARVESTEGKGAAA